ncbi:MAG: type II toxin-antitoxin system HicB family antitoxin [Thermoguttaceae bacterium]|nr:type II toxin-antitoxin system HicB family antitoxin [Thermoguttaceae bacterium]
MKKFVFPAIAETCDGFANYCVSFPDLQGCTTTGNTLEECRRNAVEALELHLSGMLLDGDKIPEPSSEDSFELTSDELVFLVEVTLEEVNEVTVPLSLPLDLYTQAQVAGVDFSSAFLRGVKAELQLQ